MKLPNKREFSRAVAKFKRYEKRDAMYVTATYLVKRFWNDSNELSNGLGVLLLTWNQACYRYGSFDFDELADCIEENRPALKKLRNKKLLRISDDDGVNICHLFEEFQDALRSQSESGDERYSAVGTVKALHLLAPHYFPLWDEAIAIAYGYRYNRENGAQKYLAFCKDMLKFKKHVTEKGFVEPDENALKKIDEYNYVTYTKPKWLDRR